MQDYANLLNGSFSSEGETFEVVSPIDKTVLGVGHLLSAYNLEEVFKKTKPINNTALSAEHFSYLAKLINEQKDDLINQIVIETGYTKQNCIDIVEGSVEFVKYFLTNIAETKTTFPASTFSYEHKTDRELRIIPVRAGVVSIMTPQNAPLILELTTLLNALAAGNGVILRPSSQNVGTASKLAALLIKAFPPEILTSVTFVSCKAKDFLDLSYRYSNLIHYIGSSFHGKNILQDALEKNVKVLVDGEGSSIVVVDKTANIDEAVNACKNGIIRCSGELCSTVRTIIVHKDVHAAFLQKLKAALSTVEVGDPREEGISIGPLFHEKQVERIREVASKYNVITDSKVIENLGPNYMSPLLCKLGEEDIKFVNEAFYGPLAGVVSYEGDGWKKWVEALHYKLNACVFSVNKNFIQEFIEKSESPRIVINNDPSIESVFEPWGAFLPCGQNEVSYWVDKYRKYVQIDVLKSFQN